MASAGDGQRPFVKRGARFLVRRARRAYAYGLRRLKKISANDTMFRWTEPGHYFAVGESARKCIEASLAAAEKRDIRRILDFGCGYGRVLRVLRKEFPDATITASDIDRDAVDFCTAQFGVKGIYSSADPNDVQFDDWFDLIWVGTVFTQLDKTSWEAWLPALRDALADDGVLIFTTIGPPSVAKIRNGEQDYGFAPAPLASMLERYTETGFAFGDRPGLPGGICLVEPKVAESLAEAAGLRRVNYIPAGWDDHEDVFTCRVGGPSLHP